MEMGGVGCFAGGIVGACPPVATIAPPKGRRGRPAI
jgi:hypothetical protein